MATATAEINRAVDAQINFRYWATQMQCRECDWTGKRKDADDSGVLPICPKCGTEDSLDDAEN
jgi:Zn finger protein HypA/HybF involved in hydrogenase expression